MNQAQDQIENTTENPECDDNKSNTNSSPGSNCEKRSLPKSPVKRMR